jgi:hypothetical protein
MRTIHAILALLLWLGAFPAASESVYRYHHRWRQVASEHFIAVYPAAFSNQARDFILEAENAHSLLKPGFPIAGRRPTWLVLSDTSDDPNGSAAAFPVKVVNAFLQHPASADEFNNVRNWPRVLLLHEYTHILQLDQTRGCLYPWHFSMNNLLPVWMIEGLAVWDESAYTEEGRGRSAWVDMYFRTDCLEKFAMGIDRMTTFPDVWPFGSVPYVYGRQFYDWLAAKFGEAKIKDLSRRNAYRVPYFQAGLALGTFGKTLPDLYREFRKDESRRYTAILDSRTAGGLSKTVRSFPPRGRTEYLATGQGRLWFYRKDEYRPGMIVALDASTGRQSMVRREPALKGLAVSPDRIYFARSTRLRDTAESYDLWSCDPRGRRPKRLTRGEHVSSPFVVQGDDAVYYVSRTGPWTTVIRKYDPAARSGSVVFAPAENLVILEAVGTAETFYLIARREKGVQDIYACDRQSGFLTRLTSNSLLECGLSLDPAGERLLFSADAEGVYDAFSLDLRSSPDVSAKVARLSRVLTGFFSPVLHAGDIWGLEYGRHGFGVSRLEAPLEQAVEWPVETDQPACDLSSIYGISAERRFDGLAPFVSSAIVLPYLDAVPLGPGVGYLYRYGGSVEFLDLFRETYLSFVLFAGQSMIFSEPLQYAASFRTPLAPWLALRIEHDYRAIKFTIDSHDSWGNPTGPVTFVSEAVTAKVGLEFTASQRTFRATVIPWVEATASLRHLSRLNPAAGLTFGFSDLSTTRRSLVPERGWSVSGDILVWGPALLSLSPHVLNFSFYLPLGRSVVLSSRNYLDPGAEEFGHELAIHIPVAGMDRGGAQWPFFFRTFGVEFLVRDVAAAGDWPAGDLAVGPGLALSMNLGYWAPVTLHAALLFDGEGTLWMDASIDTPLDSKYHSFRPRGKF